MNSVTIAFKAPVAAVAKAPAPSDTGTRVNAQSTDSTKNSDGGSNFAGTLHQVSGKSGKKSEAAKGHTATAGGGSLPADGSVSPPAAAPSAATPSPSDPTLPGNDADPTAVGSVAGGAGETAATAAGAPVAGTSGTAGGQPSAAAPPPAGSSTQSASSSAQPGTYTLADAMAKVGAVPADGSPGASDSSSGGTDAAGNPPIAGNGSVPAASAAGSDAGASSVAAATAAAAVPNPGAASAAASAVGGAAGGAKSLAFASSLRAAENDDTDASEGADSTANAGGAGSQTVGQTQINLALAEGSDATGATASALQAANAAASTPPAPIQAPVMPSAIPSAADGGSSPASAISSAPAVTTLSGSSGLANDGSSHAHGDAGDSGSALGGGGADGGAALQQLTAATASSSTDAAPATMRVHAPVDSTDFPQAVADRVSFAVDNNWSSAKLQVTPPQLGPIDLQIAVQGEHAQVMMSTHSAVTREALETSIPKLKEMLGSQGFTQVSVDISQRSFQDRSAFSQPYTWAKQSSGSGASGAAAAAPASVSPGSSSRASIGIVDAYV